MIDIKQYQALQEQVAAAKSNADRAQGAYEQALAKLQEDYECPTVKAAEAKLKELEAAEEAAGKAYDKAYAAFMEEWGDTLAELD